MRLLTVLLDILLPPRDAARILRTTSIEDLGQLVYPLIVETTDPSVTALLPYRAPLVRALVREAKYQDSHVAQKMLGAVLHDYLSDFASDRAAFSPGPLVLVPVPLSKKRLSERGYNQVTRICEAALGEVNPGFVFHPKILNRIRHTEAQTTLSKTERLHNMVGAFEAQEPVDPNVTYIVVDDVTTTGATLAAAVIALQKAGALHIYPLALAH